MAYQKEYQPITKNPYWSLGDTQIARLVLHSIGVAQPKAQVLVNNYNNPNTKASVHGFIEPGKIIITAPCDERRKLAKKCYHIGSGSRGSYNACSIGIEMCEPSTIKYTGGASFEDLNPEKTKEYVQQVTETAAEVFADLCIFHGIVPEMITTHASANKVGFGSAHADPEHLWNHIGYTLDQFKKDVQKWIDKKNKGEDYIDMSKEELNALLDSKFAQFAERLPENYKTLNDVPSWGRSSVSNAIAAKVVSGAGTDEEGNLILNISSDFLRVIAILDRLGLLKQS